MSDNPIEPLSDDVTPAASAPPDDALRSTVTAREGGVMTVEVGTISGEIDVATFDDGSGPTTRVCYSGASEWYTPEGATLSATSGDLAAAHDAAVAALKAG